MGLLCDFLPCQIGQSAVLRVVRAAIKELGQVAIGYEGDTIWLKLSCTGTDSTIILVIHAERLCLSRVIQHPLLQAAIALMVRSFCAPILMVASLCTTIKMVH
jgi:hypothetical protein